MNRQAILDRKAGFEADIAKVTAERDRLNLMIPTLDGARQDCVHWLSVIDAEEKAAEAAKQLPEGKPSLLEMKPKAADAKA